MSVRVRAASSGIQRAGDREAALPRNRRVTTGDLGDRCRSSTEEHRLARSGGIESGECGVIVWGFGGLRGR
ncbi:hypothetical protein NDU88_005835 [Pleurodeles waltl]|uniref:Uncharacterized protein n=1 Tax=Pleurodeles waltl TaxID=8319 RepID=A0AAV7WBT3_PLEWA|nr:hypothetical protein NDU88_005835 [Pleurodeles waltl]